MIPIVVMFAPLPAGHGIARGRVHFARVPEDEITKADRLEYRSSGFARVGRRRIRALPDAHIPEWWIAAGLPSLEDLPE